MQYKTIILELLQQRPRMHEQLRQQRKLLTTMEMYARDLKASHEAIRSDLAKEQPDMEASLISSQAMEMALAELMDRLQPELDHEEPGDLSLDQAMATVISRSPRG